STTFPDRAQRARRAASLRYPVGGSGARAPNLDGVQDGASTQPGTERVQPELVDGQAEPAAPDDGGQAAEQITSPTKLIRIASMVRTLLEEVRRAPLDDAGRRRLREIHEQSLRELEGVLSPDLQKELDEVVLPFTSETPSESELRLAQAQLVGWPGGPLHGIPA